MRIIQHRHSGKMELQHRHSVGYLPINDQWKVRDDITVELCDGGYLITVKGTRFTTVPNAGDIIGCLADTKLWEKWIKG